MKKQATVLDNQVVVKKKMGRPKKILSFPAAVNTVNSHFQKECERLRTENNALKALLKAYL